MPYSKENPPAATKGLPSHAVDIYIAAFNSALAQYKGDEGKAAATAWSAVKSKYQQVGGKWVAKTEAKEAALMSDNDKHRLLQVSVTSAFPAGDNMPRPWVCDVFPGYLVVEYGDEQYRMEFAIGEDGTVELGAPVKVKARTVYEPVEALRTKYVELVQEIGRRNASMDSARIRKIVELCNELLSSENPENDKAVEALMQVEDMLSHVKTFEAGKTEDGGQYPASAFAYVPDPGKPDSWNLRLCQEGEYDKALLVRAAAALSPGGYCDKRADIPEVVLPAVRRRIREGYRAVNVPETDMPKWIMESYKGVKDMARTLIVETLDLKEAKFNGKGEADIVIIKPGFNMSKERYYPEAMLAKDYAVFEGVKMFADHPTPTEEREKPERSVRDWVANLKGVHPATAQEAAALDIPPNTLLGRAVVLEPWLQERLAQLRDKDMLAEIGVSINAIGTGSIGEVDGHKTNIIEHIVRARSVDFVTEPGAGGGVSLYESNVLDVELIGLEALREHRPDLILEVENSIKPQIQKEVKKNMELDTKVTELEGQVTTLTTERDELKTRVTEADKAKAVAETKAKLDEALSKAELPEAARARIRERFNGAQSDDGIVEAIKAEKEYIAALAESGKVKGLGPKPETKVDREALTESFKRLGMTDDEAKIAAEGR